MSVSLQLVANGGDSEGLYRGAIMQSGSPLPIGDATLGQKHYDDLVLRTSCVHTEDTLDCLRRVPYETLKAAIGTSMGIFDYTVCGCPCRGRINYGPCGLTCWPQSMALSWMPRPDGTFIQSPPMDMVGDGRVAKVPVINGKWFPHSADDWSEHDRRRGQRRGYVVHSPTWWYKVSYLQSVPFPRCLIADFRTESELRRYLRYFHLPTATEEETDRLLELYPDGASPR